MCYAAIKALAADPHIAVGRLPMETFIQACNISCIFCRCRMDMDRCDPS
jgi:hypothetical protein